jgi:hypothetical protein
MAHDGRQPGRPHWHARRARYAALRDVRGQDTEWLLFRVEQRGRPSFALARSEVVQAPDPTQRLSPDMRESGSWLDRVIFAFLQLPMLLLGSVLASLLLPSSNLLHLVFVVLWLMANNYVIYVVCWKNGGVLLVRMISFFLSHVAALAMVLLFFG